MGNHKVLSKMAGQSDVNLAPVVADSGIQAAPAQLLMMPIEDLVPYAKNARTHSPEQIELLRQSLREFGFVAPVLIDFDNNIIAGHGRVEAAKAEKMTSVPCVLVSNLTQAQCRAYILADNRLAELSEWDEAAFRLELDSLTALSFDTSVIGFQMAAPSPLLFGVPDCTPTASEISSAATAMELDDPPGQPNERRDVMHCPKCGFIFEVAK